MLLVLAPVSRVAEEVLDLLSEWSAAGIVLPFRWWRCEAGVAPDEALVVCVEQGARSERRIGDALAADQPSPVQTLAVYPLADGEPADGAFADLVEERARWLEDHVLAFDAATPSRPTMIAIPGAVGQPLPDRLFRSAWKGHVFVTPEDRDTATNVNQLTPEHFVGHVAHAIATISALWASDVPQVELDEIAGKPAGDQPVLVRPVRCYSRLVELGYIADRLAVGALSLDATGGWPNPDHLRYERLDDPSRQINSTVRRYLEHYADVLGLTEFEPLEPSARPEFSILAALRWFWRQLVDKMRRLPARLADEAGRRVVDGMADRVERLIGQDRPFDVARWRSRDLSADAAAALIEHDLDRDLAILDPPIRDVWKDLVSTVLGLIDGSELPHGWGERLRVNNRTVVITKPALLVPEARARAWAGVGAPQLRACDPRGVTAALAAPPAHSGEDDGPRTVPAELDPELERQLSVARATLVWQVGEAIRKAIDAAIPYETEPDPPQDEPPAGEAPADPPKRKRRWKILRGLVALGGSVGGVVAAWTLLSAAAALAITAAVPVLWLGLGVRAVWRAFRRSLRNEIEFENAYLERLNPLLERAVRRDDANRLRRRYREYLDWAEMLGHVTYRPWVPEPLSSVDLVAPLSAEPLPAAMNLAEVSLGQRFDSVIPVARRQVFSPTWLGELFETLRMRSDHELVERDLQLGAGGAAASGTAYGDLSQDELSSRARLRATIQAGEGRRLRESPLAERVTSFLDGVPLAELVDGVREAGSGSAMTPPLAWFEEPKDLGAFADRLRPSVVRISVVRGGEAFGGSGVLVAAGDGLIATARHVVEGAEQITVTFADGDVQPAEIQTQAVHTDLAVLRVEQSVSRPVVGLAEGDALRQGDAVVTMGHPLLQEGGPSLAWGLVAAVDRTIRLADPPEGAEAFRVLQAAYQAAGGASGSPVVDLDGRLVGIHVAGPAQSEMTGVPEYLRSAVPVAELYALLRDGSEDVAVDPVPDRSVDTTLEPVVDFLADLHPPTVPVLLPSHFVDPSGNVGRIERHVPGDVEALKHPTVAGVCGRAQLLRPSRAVVCRVEGSRPVAPDALRSFATSPDSGLT